MRLSFVPILVFAAAFCARPAFAADDLKIELSARQGWLHADLVNVSQHAVRVRKNFGYSIFALSFKVRDTQRRNRPFDAKVSGGLAEETDLPPGQRLTTKVSYDELAINYGLETGLYDVTATYQIFSPDFRVLRTYRSKPLRIRVEGDFERHMARMEERGEIFRVDLSEVIARRRAETHP